MSEKSIKDEDLKVVNGGEDQEKQYVCKKCGNIIDINTASKKVVESNGDLSSSMQYGYWCEHCNDYVAIIPADGLSADFKIDQGMFKGIY